MNNGKLYLLEHDYFKVDNKKKMNINQLPNECLVKIFDNLVSLEELMRLEVVCYRWKAMQALSLRTRTALRLFSRHFDSARFGSLTFLRGHEDATVSLPIDRITESTCQFLLERFPMLTNLDIFGCQVPMSSLITLLGGWSEQLVELSVIAHSVNLWEALELGQVQQLMSASLQSLKHLYLDMPIYPEIFPLLSQLETLCHYEHTEEAIAPVYRLLPNISDVIRNMHFFCRVHQLSHFLMMQEIPEAIISSQMKRLSLAIVNPPMLKFICSNFSALTHLDLTLSRECSLMNLLPELNQLSELTDLRLANPPDLRVFFPFYKVTTRNFRRRLQPLLTVTALHLNFELKLMRIQFVQHIFPNVQSITFNGRIFRCECFFPVAGLCRICSDAILRRLLQFRSLRRVYHDTRLLLDCQHPDSIPPNALDELFL